MGAPRKNNPLTLVERQMRVREKRVEKGMVRKEWWITEAMSADEKRVRERSGTQHVLSLFAWVLRQEIQRMDKADAEAAPKPPA